MSDQHEEFEWSEWYRKGIPELGDYIQMRGFHRDTSERLFWEGMVIEIAFPWLKIMPAFPDDYKFVATEWRKRIVNIKDEGEGDVEQEKELEHV